MISSIVANVVPPSVPSARKGISFYGAPDATVKETQPTVKPASPAPVAKPVVAEVKANEQGDTFTKKPEVTAKA